MPRLRLQRYVFAAPVFIGCQSLQWRGDDTGCCVRAVTVHRRFQIPLFPQGTQLRQQLVRVVTKMREQAALQILWQRVKPLAPMVAHQLLQQFIRVVQMGLLKHVTAEQSKAAEHAAAPAVNRVDGRLVHVLRRQVQKAGALRPVLIRYISAQLVHEAVFVRLLAA